jgi:hypothetical protein
MNPYQPHPPKTTLFRLFIVFSLVTLFFVALSGFSKTSQAADLRRDPSQYHPEQYMAMAETCLSLFEKNAQLESKSPILGDDFDEVDVAACYRVLGSQTALLQPKLFNLTIGLFLEEYQRSPKLRPSLGRLLESIGDSPEFKLEAKAQRETQMFKTVVDDVFLGLELTYGFFFAKGVVKSYRLATEVRGFRRIISSLRGGYRVGIADTKLYLRKPQFNITVGVVSADLGMLHVSAERVFSIIKIDPKAGLEALQIDIVYDQNWAQLNEVLNELRLIENNFNTISIEIIRATLRNAEMELNRIFGESEQLLGSAPHLTGRARGFSNQLLNATDILQKLYTSLGELDEEQMKQDLHKSKDLPKIIVTEKNSCETAEEICQEILD